jgi:hypothetical protein
MDQIKAVNTIRLTAQRYIELTTAQWMEFSATGEFKTKVYPSYSLCVTDKLFLTCKFDPINIACNPKLEVYVHAVDSSHSNPQQGGYNFVVFSTDKFKYTGA